MNQFALFSLMSDPRARLDRWLRCHPEVYRRIVVPAALKWEVRDKLDQANITERVLFPGLDGLGRWLRRYCTPNLSPNRADRPTGLTDPAGRCETRPRSHASSSHPDAVANVSRATRALEPPP